MSDETIITGPEIDILLERLNRVGSELDGLGERVSSRIKELRPGAGHDYREEVRLERIEGQVFRARSAFLNLRAETVTLLGQIRELPDF
jgi:hypothetical protein